MKYRDYKNFTTDNFYHIYNRGVNKQDIFLDQRDYSAFMKRLILALGKDQADTATCRIIPFPENAFSIMAYCLMPNHYHFLIRQNSNIPVGRLVKKVCTSYVSYFNKRHHRVGHLFQDVFKAKLVDTDPYLVKLSAYIHLNPGSQSFSYQYSSIREYLGFSASPVICDVDYVLGYFKNSASVYAQFLKDQPHKDQPI
jgi:putative transposase